MYTSLKLSKLLAEGGCELKALYHRTKYYYHHSWLWDLKTLGQIKRIKKYGNKKNRNLVSYPAYDILNEICVRYRIEFWGTKYDDIREHTEWVLFHLQMNRQEFAEDYIWDNCLFNPKNILKEK